MLSQNGTDWSFVSEAQLEDFVWSRLNELFGVTPLARQFSVDNQICDVLAVDSERRLTVIELKNAEDRYLVNQLTRYYDALVTNKPLLESIDYRKSIQLIGITPTFHRDNWSDKKYNRLKIQFWEFSLKQWTESQFQFSLKNLETEEQKNILFGFKPVQTEIEIPEPPRKLLKMLANISEGKRGKVLEIREKILSFHERMKEHSSGSSILYGSAKNKTCAELRLDPKRKDIALFLWIPFGNRSRKTVNRVRVWTDFKKVTDIGHVPKGLGSMVNLHEYKTASVTPLKKLLPRNSYGDSTERYFTDKSYRERWVEQNKVYAYGTHYRGGLALTIEQYQLMGKYLKIAEQEALHSFLDLALMTWLSKL